MRTIRLLALAALGLGLTACLDVKDEMRIAADGSGTLKTTYVVDLKQGAALMEMVKMFFPTDEAGAAPNAVPDVVAPGWLREAARGVEGYTLEKADSVTKDDKRTTTVQAKFTSLAAAAKAEAFLMSTVALEKTPAGAWKLSFKAGLPTDMGGGGGGGMPPMSAKDILEMLEEQLSGMRVEESITVPTKILETNGTKSEDGKTVTFVVDFAKLKEGKDIELTVTFEAAEGLKLEPFRHRPSFESLARRIMEPVPGDPVQPPAPAAPTAPEAPKPPAPPTPPAPR